MRFRGLLIFLSMAILGCGCNHSEDQMPVVSMPIGKQTFDIEIAITPQQQEKGLMQRDSMPADHGMIFVFDSETVLEFWMKNTRFPLDIIFLDSRGVVVSVRQMESYDLHRTSSIMPARYAIELNHGAAESCRIKIGDKVDIPAVARSKAK